MGVLLRPHLRPDPKGSGERRERRATQAASLGPWVQGLPPVRGEGDFGCDLSCLRCVVPPRVRGTHGRPKPPFRAVGASLPAGTEQEQRELTSVQHPVGSQSGRIGLGALGGQGREVRDGGIRFRPASVFCFPFQKIPVLWQLGSYKGGFITSPPSSQIFLKGVAVSPTHSPFSNLLLLPLSPKM